MQRTGRQNEESLRGFLPLAIFTVLAPGAVGAFAVLRLMGGPALADAGVVIAAGLATGATLLHLGQPQQFFRATGNFLRSWLAREAVLFGGFTGLAGLYFLLRLTGLAPAAANVLAGVATAAGLLAVLATARVYAIPTRPAWGHWTGQVLFGVTLFTLGPVLAATLLLAAIRLTNTSAAVTTVAVPVLHIFIWLLCLLLGGLASLWRRQYLKSAGVLGALGIERWYGFVQGLRLLLGIVLPIGLLIYGLGAGRYPVWAMALAVCLGELAERLLFFRAVVPVTLEGEIDRVRQEYMKVPAAL